MGVLLYILLILYVVVTKTLVKGRCVKSGVGRTSGQGNISMIESASSTKGTRSGTISDATRNARDARSSTAGTRTARTSGRRPRVSAVIVATAKSYALNGGRRRDCSNDFGSCCSSGKRSCFFNNIESVFRTSSVALVGLRYILSSTARHMRGH